MGGMLSIPVNLNNWESLKTEALALYKSIESLSIPKDYERFKSMKIRWYQIISLMNDIAAPLEDRQKRSEYIDWIVRSSLEMHRLVYEYDILHRNMLDSKAQPLLSGQTFLDAPFGVD